MQDSYQRQYYTMCNMILNQPYKEVETRIGKVKSRFGHQIRVDLRREFPLMDLKKINLSTVLHELLWFINGDTNIKYLKENKCGIWDDDCYRYYNEKFVPQGFPEMNKEEFISSVFENRKYTFFSKEKNKHITYHYGDLEKIYGYQWRSFNGKTDQLKNCIEKLKSDPDDRRMIVTAHNPTDIEDGNVGLPSCHNYFQFYTYPNSEGGRNLAMEVHLRSNDIFLGNAFNVASYSILLMMIGKLVNMTPTEILFNINDAHIYNEHIEAVEIWMSRYETIYDYNDTFCKSKLEIKGYQKTIDDFKAEDFILTNYNPQPFIKAKLLT